MANQPLEGVKAVLMDVDDTLLNFGACARACVGRALSEQGIALNDELMDIFHRVNGKLWHSLETGEIRREDIYARRFPEMLSQAGLHADGNRMETVFRESLRQTAIPVEGAQELLAGLAGRYPVYVASNAVGAQQRKRLTAAGMLERFSGFFTSFEMGVSKPAPAFFRACLEGLGRPDPRSVVMIGDSLHADISGAARAGLHTVWFNPGHRMPDPDLPVPEYTVYDLPSIREII